MSNAGTASTSSQAPAWMITLILAAISFGTASAGTERPVIGILSQELSETLAHRYDPNIYKSFIAASYVKYFESSGARVVPIAIGESQDYYRKVVRELNGVVFPGGGTAVFISTGYVPSGKLLMTALEEAAANGKPIPALGICLGMELMAWYDYSKKKLQQSNDVGSLTESGMSSQREKKQPVETTFDEGPLVRCSMRGVNKPLKFRSNVDRSAILSRAKASDKTCLRERSITAHEHTWCVTEDSLNKTGIRHLWEVYATSPNKTGKEFIAIMESPQRSFYAIIFHPEKNSFEWETKKAYVHDPDAIDALRVFGDSFVQMCRQNDNALPADDERRQLIYRYTTVDSGSDGLSYEQLYLFRDHDIDTDT